MITIDTRDDEVVQTKKPERSRTPDERRSANADLTDKTMRHSRLGELARRLLRGVTGEEEK